MSEKKISLTSAEIAVLWMAYMSASMSKCMLAFMRKHINDEEIKLVIQYAYDHSSDQLTELEAIFEKEKYAIPIGFSDSDTNEHAPWLFTDVFCLTYVTHMSKVGMVTYSSSLSMSSRKDIRDHFTHTLEKTTKLFNQSSEVGLEKGVNARSPHIEVPKEILFVQTKNYMSGISPLSDHRPLNAFEISHLYQNITTNSIGIKLCLAFAQTSESKEVKDFMLRGKEISKKHIKVFVDVLLNDDIEAPHIPDVAVSDSTVQTFSDKLAMFHMSLMTNAGIGNYASAAASSQRSDLMVSYERLSLEVSKLAKNGADIMIKNKWLEQPPGIKDREKLARERNKN